MPVARCAFPGGEAHGSQGCGEHSFLQATCLKALQSFAASILIRQTGGLLCATGDFSINSQALHETRHCYFPMTSLRHLGTFRLGMHLPLTLPPFSSSNFCDVKLSIDFNSVLICGQRNQKSYCSCKLQFMVLLGFVCLSQSLKTMYLGIT